jgi:hypothetical protein
MSRGLGVYQRLVISLLSADQRTITQGLPISEVRRGMAGVDKANRRRAIRSLIARGAVEEVSDPGEASGELVLRLTFLEQLAAWWRVDPPSYYHESDI